MEMDRQTILVLFGAILALTLFGGSYLSSPAGHHERATFKQEDIRYKYQQEAAKEKKTKKKKPAIEPIISSSDSGDSNEEPSDADNPQEEPEIE
jgi:hypothetical protein